MPSGCACGHRNRAGARFCAQCGGPLQPAPASALAAAPAGVPDRRPSLRPTTGSDLARRLWPVAGLMVGITAINVVAAIAGGSSDTTSLPGHLIVSGLTSALVLFFVLADRTTLAELLDPRRVRAHHLGLVALAFAGLHTFMFGYQGALRIFGVELMDPRAGYAGWPLWGVLLVMALEPAVLEELAFRGVIMERLSGVLERGETLLLQAALFAVAHMLPLMFPSHFVMGLVLGLLCRHTRSLYPCMFLHGAWNASVVLLV